jgi:hypothetical protein
VLPTVPQALNAAVAASVKTMPSRFIANPLRVARAARAPAIQGVCIPATRR